MLSHVTWDVPRNMRTFWSALAPWDHYSLYLCFSKQMLLDSLVYCRLWGECGRDDGSVSFQLHVLLAVLRTAPQSPPGLSGSWCFCPMAQISPYSAKSSSAVPWSKKQGTGALLMLPEVSTATVRVLSRPGPGLPCVSQRVNPLFWVSSWKVACHSFWLDNYQNNIFVWHYRVFKHFHNDQLILLCLLPPEIAWPIFTTTMESCHWGPKGLGHTAAMGQGWPWLSFLSPCTRCSMECCEASNHNDICYHEEAFTQDPVLLLDSYASCGVCRPLPELCPGYQARLCEPGSLLGGEVLSPRMVFAVLIHCSEMFSSLLALDLSEARQSSWWSGHSPLRGGQWVEFATTPALRFGRQTTSVSDEWECQVIPAWWDYSSEDHEESIPPEEEKNSWHRSSAGPSAKGNTGSQAESFQVLMGLGREGTGVWTSPNYSQWWAQGASGRSRDENMTLMI